MAFKNHVFISYSHPDNLAASGKGFITRLEDALVPFLSHRLKRTPPIVWRDQRLSDNADFDPVIIDSLKGSAVMLAVLTDNYVGSEWCRREATTFCEAAEAGLGLSPGDKPRLFKVVMLPPSGLEGLPESMVRQGRGTPFFTRVGKDRRISQDERDTPMPLDPSYGAEYESQFNLAVSLLAQEIADSLKALDGGAAPVDAKKACVYLAQCDEDRQADREALRSELRQFGFQVLPDRELPQTDTELRSVVAGMLERSVLSIHLLGSGPGKVPSGAKLDSELVIQNELAVQRAQVAPLRRLVSLPRGTVCPRDNHQQFLQAMLNDPAVLGRANLIDGDRGKLIEEMHVALKAAEREAAEAAAQAARAAQAQAQASAAPAAAGQKLKLYVLYTLDDLDATGDLRDALEERYDLRTPVFEGTPEEARQANEARLTECDAVLLFWGAGTDGWMASQLSETDKALAWRKGRPWRAVLQCVAGPATALKKDRVRKPRPNVINALDAETATLLAAIEATLGEPGHG